jgi:hypothetical protein
MTGEELPGRVLIREVGPRDEFQNEPERISTARAERGVLADVAPDYRSATT